MYIGIIHCISELPAELSIHYSLALFQSQFACLYSLFDLGCITEFYCISKGRFYSPCSPRLKAGGACSPSPASLLKGGAISLFGVAADRQTLVYVFSCFDYIPLFGCPCALLL